jgi:aspartate-semialdehyde dehydrogenase
MAPSSTDATGGGGGAGGYHVGIVGATGAVGKEIRSVLEKRFREFPVSRLRVFGSERSAGKILDTQKFGTVTIEPFSVGAARECDVVFLAVSGDFALEHARAMAEGDGGCVVIDNSVRKKPGARGDRARA